MVGLGQCNAGNTSNLEATGPGKLRKKRLTSQQNSCKQTGKCGKLTGKLAGTRAAVWVLGLMDARANSTRR